MKTEFKEQIRLEALAIREKAFDQDQLISEDGFSVAGRKLKDNLCKVFDRLKIENHITVSSYISVRSEITTSAIIHWLWKKGNTICLPVISEKDCPLTFYEWKQHDRLQSGKFNIPVPIDTRRLIPDVVLCPLVSFDSYGNRMGYGGGYYDRTIQKLRKEKKITIIGLGFLEQKSEKALPVDCNDQRLDVMVTNEKIFIF